MSKNPEFFPQFTKEDKAAVRAVLDRGDLMSGREVAAFEEELAAYFGKRYAVCVSSGTAALECAFVATGEGTLIHPHGFVAILSAARAAGRHPTCSDSGVATDVLGQHYVLDGFGVQRTHDCAHRFDKEAAEHRDVACFSFNANKFIACGGGVLVTNDKHVAASARLHRNHGRDGGPEVVGTGRNLRMGEINAALGRSQLKRIGKILEKRHKIVRMYDKMFGRMVAGERKSWFMVPLWCPHENHGFRSLADFRLFNTATENDRRTALLPIYPHMTRADVEAVVACLRERKCL